jgi:hypothetical protein
MSTITFDTFEFNKTLREAGFDEKQAEALTKAHRLSIEQSALVTKQDLTDAKLDMLKWLIGLILGQTALLLTVLPKMMGH